LRKIRPSILPDLKNENMNLWDKYMAYVEGMEELSPDFKAKVRDTYSFLREEFGETFLTTAKHGHFLAGKVFNRAPWQLEDLISIVDTLKNLKGLNSNYQKLIEKLRSTAGSKAEGVPLIELAKMILAQGLHLKIEPEVPYIKKPDLEIINPENGDKLFAELSVLNESDDRNRKTESHHMVFQMIEMLPPYLPYSCKLKKVIDGKEIEIILENIKLSKEKTIAHEKLEVYEDEYIIAGFSTETKIDDLKTWTASQGLRMGQVAGLELDFDDSKRIVNNKIGEKAKQLPSEFNGLIFIRVSALFFLSEGVRNTAVKVQSEINKYPHVIGVVVYSFLGEKKEGAMYSFDGGFLTLTQVDQLTCRYVLFILNKKTDLKIHDETLHKLFSLCKS
jgi:hypothetical protein